MPDESEFLCGDWVWDATIREMRHYPRQKNGHSETPDAVERLDPARRVALHLWSQQPMQTATGHTMSPSQGRIVVEYTDRTLDINEDNRSCARKLADAIAATYGLTVEEEGAPTGRRSGNLPQRDEMGRLRAKDGRVETALDEVGGVLEVWRSKRPFGKVRRSFRTNEIRRLEFARTVNGPNETFAVQAIVGPEEEAFPLATYTGLEGWADPGEWREFTSDLAARLHVDTQV